MPVSRSWNVPLPFINRGYPTFPRRISMYRVSNFILSRTYWRSYWTIMEFSISFLSINIYKYRRYLFQPLSIGSISFVFYYLEKGHNFETVLLLCFPRWTKLKFNTFISMRMHFQSRIFFFFCIWQSTKKKIRTSISLETVQFTTIARLSSLELN